MGLGSGVIFANDNQYSYGLTNNHVIPQGSEFTIKSPNYSQSMEGIRIVSKSGLDLALFKVPYQLASIPLGTKYPEKSERVRQIGYPGGVGPSYKEGTSLGLLSYSQGSPGVWHVTLRMRIIGGDSGSPVYNDNNEVAAIIWGSDGITAQAVPIEYAHQLIEQSCPWIPRRPGGVSPAQPVQPPVPSLPKPQVPMQPYPQYPQYPPQDDISKLIEDIRNNIRGIREDIGKLDCKPKPEIKQPEIKQPICQPDNSLLFKKQLDDIRADIQVLTNRVGTFQGKVGPVGPIGSVGPAGPPGNPGKDGKDSKGIDQTEVDRLNNLLSNIQSDISKLRNQRLQAELYDADGQRKQTVEFGPGQPLKLKLVPLK